AGSYNACFGTRKLRDHFTGSRLKLCHIDAIAGRVGHGRRNFRVENAARKASRGALGVDDGPHAESVVYTHGRLMEHQFLYSKIGKLTDKESVFAAAVDGVKRPEFLEQPSGTAK